MTYEHLRRDPAVNEYITQADASLQALGYTEHSFPHVTRVAAVAGQILEALGYDSRTAELARIAGYLHDIGNLVNRQNHSQSGALMAFRILEGLGFPPEETAAIVTAIGNHDEGTGVPVNALAAALFLADKSDVRRNRVRQQADIHGDIHDRVNHSVTSSDLSVDPAARTITLSLSVDTQVSSVMEYFEIFMKRMLLCRAAAQRLDTTFKLTINGQELL